MDWRTVFAGLNSATAATQAIAALARRRHGTARALLLELQRNINLIFLCRRDGAPAEKVIVRLETRKFETAVEAGFDFNTLARKSVTPAMVKGAPALAPYAGWSTEQLFERVYLKIHELKALAEIGTRHSPARLGVRLANLLKLMLLLIKHIRPH